MEKSIEKALTDAGLSKREVSPFMRVRVVGLTSKMYQGQDSPKEGLITIWNPTEKQVGPCTSLCWFLTFNSCAWLLACYTHNVFLTVDCQDKCGDSISSSHISFLHGNYNHFGVI